MKVEILRCLSDNFSYLVIDEKNRDACIIDPSESSSVIKFLENKKINLKFILNTHHHADHVDGNIELKNKYKAKVIGFIDDKNRIPGIDICLKDKERVQEIARMLSGDEVNQEAIANAKKMIDI